MKIIFCNLSDVFKFYPMPELEFRLSRNKERYLQRIALQEGMAESEILPCSLKKMTSQLTNSSLKKYSSVDIASPHPLVLSSKNSRRVFVEAVSGLSTEVRQYIIRRTYTSSCQVEHESYCFAELNNSRRTCSRGLYILTFLSKYSQSSKFMISPQRLSKKERESPLEISMLSRG